MVYHAPRSASSSINQIGDTPEDQVDQRMSDRKRVPDGQSVRPFGATLDRFDGHFLVAESLIEQHADDIGLKAEAERIGVPADHVVTQMHREPIVVMQAKAAD